MVMEAPPVLLPGNIQPTYPAAAVFSRAQGKAVVRAQVLPSGQVGEAFIRQSTGAQALDQAALATVRGWKFKPARRNGQPVPAWVNVPIEYRNPS
jgi:protein TonB